MFCKKCGAKVADDAAFCTACGALLREGSTDEDKENIISEQYNQSELTGKKQNHLSNKKIIVAVICVFIVFTVGIGWSFANRLTPEEEITVKRVSEQIDELGQININSGTSIQKVEKAYNALSSKCQRHVENRKILKQAKKEWNQLKADFVSASIDEIDEVTINSQTEINNAREEYDDLNDEQKKLVTNYSVLTEAENEFSAVQVQDLINRIAELNNSGTINATIKTTLVDIKNDYDDMSDEQQQSVSNYNDFQSIYNDYREKSVSQCIQLIEAIGPVTLDNVAAVEAASAAYENVLAVDASKITNQEVLLAAQNTLKELRKQEEEKAKTITAGTAFETTHWAITLVKAELTAKILPNSLSGYYNYYYQTDGSIYADLKFTIKNTGVSIRAIESILDSVSVTYDGRYTYTSYSLFTSSGNDVDKVYSWDGIDALNSTTLHVAVGLPEEALTSGKSVKVAITMDGVDKIVNIR